MASIDWSTLHHAYGPAGDIPALLARAWSAPAPATYRDEPWFALWSALYHQDDVYPASYAAVPELIAIAAERGGAVAAESLFLAASIELRRHLPGAPEVSAAVQSEYDRAVAAARPLTANLPHGTPDPDGKLAVAAAVFGGDFARARALLDEGDGDDEQ